MTNDLKAPLSPHEAITLRRVAHGVSPLKDMSRRDLQRLRQLSLIIDVRGQPELTAILGRTP